MQVITTKHLAPTDTKGSRFKATCAAGSVTIGHEYAYGHEQNHIDAARALCDKLGWPYHFVTGQDHKGNYQHIILHANMAAPDPTGGMMYKYRSAEIQRVYQSMGDEYPATLQIVAGEGGKQTRHLSASRRDVAALLDLFNQID